LEFVVLIVELAAVITWLKDTPEDEIRMVFPNGAPFLPRLLSKTDNQVAKSWSNKGFTTSAAGQALLYIYSDILRQNRIGHDVEYLPGELNVCADDISRPSQDLLINPSFDLLSQQIFLKHPSLKTWKCFHPSPELLRSLSSALYTTANRVPTKIPQHYGVFTPTGSSGLPLHLL